MKVVLLLLTSLLTYSFLYGQSNYIVTGTIKDSTGQLVIGANVSLMTNSDTLRGVSGESGSFRITGVKNPTFTLRITSLGYDPWEKATFPGESLDFQIVLKPNMKLLNEVVVRGKSMPVVYKKDTVEYDVNRFTFSEHDMVEDLMRRLPGLEVNSDGTISMMGQKVTKIMINGQEFMVNDIKTLTSLIPASLINKIQLIDDYGDLNRMRGVKRGETQKIINLKTNAGIGNINKGRLTAAYGEYGLYQIGASYLKFSSKQQYNFSINNTNQGQYTGKGNNSNVDLGIGQKFSEKFTMNLGVNYVKNNTEIISNSSSETVTSDGSLYNSVTSKGNNGSNNVRFKSEWNYSPNNSNRFLIHFDGNSQDIQSRNNIANIQTGYQRKDQYSVNDIKSKSNGIKGDVYYIYLFKKPGRNLAFGMSGSKANNKFTQNSINNFRYFGKDTAQYKDSLVHQIVSKENDNYENKIEVSYIEPLMEKKSFELRYSFLNSITKNYYKTSAVELNGKLVSIDSLSNRFEYEIRQMEGDFIYQYKNDKTTYWIGVNFIPYTLSGQQHIKSASWFPVFQFDYQVAKNSVLKILYKGSNSYPTYNQIATVPDYSDLQNIVVGNPYLKTGKKHEFSVDYKSSRETRSFFTNLSFSTIRDNVSATTRLIDDSYGTVKQENSFVNTSGNFLIANKSGWTRRIGKKDNSIMISESSSYSRNQQYYNSLVWNVSSLSSNIKAEVSLKLGVLATTPNISYIYTRNAFGENMTNVEIHSFNYYSYNVVKITPNVLIELVCSGQENFSPLNEFRTRTFLLDSRIHCWWLKRKIITSFYIENVLNNSTPSSQSVSSNMISNTSFNNRGRYLMFNFIYDFHKVK